MTDTLFASAGGFDVLPVPGGFKIVDTDTYNPWRVDTVFPTSAAAEDYAYRCNDFKRGRRMTVNLQPWESLVNGRSMPRCGPAGARQPGPRYAGQRAVCGVCVWKGE